MVEALEGLLAGLDGAAPDRGAPGGLFPPDLPSLGGALNESSFAFPGQTSQQTPLPAQPDIGLQLGGVKSQMQAFLRDG